MKTILDFDNSVAKRFFLQRENYSNVDLPSYFDFSIALDALSKTISSPNLMEVCVGSSLTQLKKLDDINHKFVADKDGKFSWRQFQLIHPAIYVSLVNLLTEKDNWSFIQNRFREFQKDNRIECASIPIQQMEGKGKKESQILTWWAEIEQRSIELSLDYEYVLYADIANCYDSIYTHSIMWALHGKAESKTAKNGGKLNDFLGNQIDNVIQSMAYGQTNGLPQGSVLMDFIAEMILGYIDLCLSMKIREIFEFKILRYRDDFKIFAHTATDAEIVLKELSEVLIGLGLRLNSRKTIASTDIIKNALKPGKSYLLRYPILIRNTKTGGLAEAEEENVSKRLLALHSFTLDYPNDSALLMELGYVFKMDLSNLKNVYVVVALLSEIALKNPKTYPVVVGILSKIFDPESKNITHSNIDELIQKIIRKFSRVPSISWLEVWLQRLIYPHRINFKYKELLCHVAANRNATLWNSCWLNDDIKKLMKNIDIVNREEFSTLDYIIPESEITLFTY